MSTNNICVLAVLCIHVYKKTFIIYLIPTLTCSFRRFGSDATECEIWPGSELFANCFLPKWSAFEKGHFHLTKLCLWGVFIIIWGIHYYLGIFIIIEGYSLLLEVLIIIESIHYYWGIFIITEVYLLLFFFVFLGCSLLLRGIHYDWGVFKHTERYSLLLKDIHCYWGTFIITEDYWLSLRVFIIVEGYTLLFRGIHYHWGIFIIIDSIHYYWGVLIMF